MVNVAAAVRHLAPTGVLRAAVNLSNPLLIASPRPPAMGVAPSLAAAVAARLGVPLELVPYAHPHLICAAADAWRAGGDRAPATRPWDVALLAADPDRAASIDFAPAYCEIRATCLVPDASPIATCDDANRDGVRVSVKGGGAYDLWLSRHWTKATLVRAPTLEASYRAYVDDRLEVLAGLRPRLVEDAARCDGHRLLDDSFMSVAQAIGSLRVEGPDASAGREFLRDFVEDARRPAGLVEDLFAEHGVVGRLSLPAG